MGELARGGSVIHAIRLVTSEKSINTKSNNKNDVKDNNVLT